MKTIWPMGAELPTDKKLERLWEDSDYIAEEKLDGERIIIHVGEAGSVRLTTRSGSISNSSSPIEITHRWPEIQTFNFKDIPAGTILDAEVFSYILRPEEVAGLLNYKSEIAVPDNTLYCAIFDCIYWRNSSLEAYPWLSRYVAAQSAVKSIKNDFVIMPLKTSRDKRKFFDDIVAVGGEGVVLKNIMGRYVQGKKPANVWVKAKKKDTFDCIITGFKSAKEGKYKGLIGSIELSQYKAIGEEGGLVEYELFPVCYASGIADDVRKYITENPEQYLGQVAVIEATERIPNSLSLRHPRIKFIRPEGSKDPKDCIVEEF